MALRLEYRTAAPAAVRALAELNAYADGCAVPQGLRRLLETLVSHRNGCSYCIETHRRQAMELGERRERLDSLETWREAAVFSAAERVAFAWAEGVTDIPQPAQADALLQELRAHFSDKEIVDLTFIVLAMNAWNRLAISFGREAESVDSKAQRGKAP